MIAPSSTVDQVVAPDADQAAPAGPAQPAAPARPARQHGLDLLRIFAISGVVAIHVIGTIVSNAKMRGSISWWIATAIDLGVAWTVPVFVMISGALVLDPRAHKQGPAAFYRKRFTRIVPAMIVWHLVYLIGVRMVIRHERLDGPLVARLFIDSKVFTALYFLWLICGLYVVAPVLAAFLQDNVRRARIFAAVALTWTVISFVIPGLAKMINLDRPIYMGSWNMWWPYVGLFVAGLALRHTVLSRRWTLVAAALVVGLMTEVVWQYGTDNKPALLTALAPVSYFGAVVIAASLLLFVVAVSVGSRLTLPLRVAGAVQRLSNAAFGVFLVHLLVFELVKRAFPSVAHATSLPITVCAYLVVLATSFAVSIGASKVPYLRAIF